MKILKLTYDETISLEKSGCVYALRDEAVYLVEKDKEGTISLIAFYGKNFKLIPTYQKSLDIP